MGIHPHVGLVWGLLRGLDDTKCAFGDCSGPCGGEWNRGGMGVLPSWARKNPGHLAGGRGLIRQRG